MYFCCYVYVFLLLRMFCSVLYIVFMVPNGTLRLPGMRFIRAFSSVLRQTKGYNSQRRGARPALFPIAVVNCVVLCTVRV